MRLLAVPADLDPRRRTNEVTQRGRIDRRRQGARDTEQRSRASFANIILRLPGEWLSNGRRGIGA